MTEATINEKRHWGVSLMPGVVPANMFAFYAACLAGITLSTFLPQMLPYLLTEFLNTPEDQKGSVTGTVALVGEIAIILTVGIWGSASDKIGRRPVTAVGFVIMSIAVMLFPHADTLNELLVYRALFGIGVAAFVCMTITLMADYAQDKSRGRATGFLGMANGFGAMLTVFLLLKLPSIFQAQGMSIKEAGFASYYVVAGFGFAIAAWMWLGLQKKTSIARDEPNESFLEIVKKGLVAAKDPGVALAYAAAFVSRGNLTIVGSFFTLWLSEYGINELGMNSAEALAKAGGIVAISYAFSLIGAPFFGILTDKIGRVDALVVTLIFSAIGYGSTFLVFNPFGVGMIICAVFIGLGEVGVIITSGVLIAQQTPAKIRGAVIGFFNLSGAVGILVAAAAGGWMYDNWREPGPFVLFGFFALVVIVWAMLVRNRVVPAEGSDM